MSHSEVAMFDVLIVDGDHSFSDAFAAYLSQHGYRVVGTAPADMQTALSRFKSGVVLCDIDGADVAGVNLPAQLLNIRPDLTCVAMARRSNLRQISPPFSDGEFGFVNKSDGFNVALNVIDTCFKKRRLLEHSNTPVEQANEVIEQVNHAKIEFLAKVSHELRTPLNAIIGFSELIMRNTLGPLGNEQYRSYIEDIHLSGRHLLDIINDILDFAKAEAGQLTLQESDVDVRAVVKSLQRYMGPRIRDGGIILNDLLPADLPRLWCDQRKLRQMLLNLLTNAEKFTPPGGRIDISASQGPEGFTLSVRDTGAGIDKADLARVILPFVQGESTLARRHEGTGLGLPLVKAMIELHGGRIELESVPKEGTTVRLIFPRERSGVRESEQDIAIHDDVAIAGRSALQCS
jgi:signal transduction histidine kinase